MTHLSMVVVSVLGLARPIRDFLFLYKETNDFLMLAASATIQSRAHTHVSQGKTLVKPREHVSQGPSKQEFFIPFFSSICIWTLTFLFGGMSSSRLKGNFHTKAVEKHDVIPWQPCDCSSRWRQPHTHPAPPSLTEPLLTVLICNWDDALLSLFSFLGVCAVS